MLSLFFRLLATVAGLWTASAIVPGLSIDTTSTLIWAAILLGVVNAIVRPFIIILTLPISVISLGLFVFVINAGMLGIVAWLLDDFAVSGFFAALFGSLVVSVVTLLTSWFIGDETKIAPFADRRP